jgi:hypothetical protein
MKMKVSLCPICSSVINHKFLIHHSIIYRMKWIGGAKEWADKGMFWMIMCKYVSCHSRLLYILFVFQSPSQVKAKIAI